LKQRLATALKANHSGHKENEGEEMSKDKLFRTKYIKERLSQTYLYLSEKKAFQKMSFFKDLKELRDRQKKDALEYYEKSKRPSGNDIGLHSFYLFECFLLEDLSELGKELDNLFAKNSATLSYQSFLEQLANRPGRATCTLPLIVNKRTGFIPAERISIDHIPDFIKYLELKLIKIMPSLVIMTIRVMLEEELVSLLWYCRGRALAIYILSIR